jgi:NADH:ubiquinone oxidoreductase subunit 4 (chain M)
VILAAVYLLWAFQRVFMGRPDEATAAMPEINARELLAVVPLLGISLFLGIWPKPALDRIEPSVKALIQHVENNSNYQQPDVAKHVVPRAIAGVHK